MSDQRCLLRMQVHLRKSGFRDVPLDGKRTPLFDGALVACLVNQACANGLSQRN
jgi:hypothetical protein